MIILGINAYHADSSAAIFVDGKLLAATEEERFTRVKHWAGFPTQAIGFCLREVGVSLDQVNYITVGRDPSAKLAKKLVLLLRNPIAGMHTVSQRLRNRKEISSLEHEFARHFSGVSINYKIKRIEHHRSHMASAFFASPFEESAILSIDGAGDFTTTMIGVGHGNKIRVLDSVDFPVSCGTFYTAFTQFLGFPNYGDEYKVMGLAPYGEPRFVDKVREVLRFTDDGLFTWDSRYFRSPREVVVTYGDDHIPKVGNLFSHHFTDVFGQPRRKGDDLTQERKDLAASVQRVTEELLVHILESLQKRTGLKNICVAGGVAQNSVANGKLIGRTDFENLYVPSAGHDAGLSMGSALYLQNHILGMPRQEPIYSAFTGARFSNEEIESFLKARGVSYQRLPDEELFERVVDALLQPGVVGWFNGRAEFGPRALGARSILADPRNPGAKELLNLKIKKRESFRPFAPSILEEHVAEYFEKEEMVPFMERVFSIRESKRGEIPAVTHVDGTGRLQTVSPTIARRYHHLIECFRQRTGVPILLNTSFNENEPIVNTPAQALDCFERTQMDMLVLENCLIVRK